MATTGLLSDSGSDEMPEPPKKAKRIVCNLCHRAGDAMISCAFCEDTYHANCLDMASDAIPVRWQCWHCQTVRREKKDVVCKQCYRAFKDKDQLKSHSLEEHGMPFLECDVISCDYKTQNKYSLSEHKRRVHSYRPYECPVDGCDKRFFSEKNRKQHLEVHSEDRQYDCDVIGCDRSYTLKRNLADHKRRRHPGVVVYEDSHKNVHLVTTSKRFRCRSGCSQRFLTEDDRKRHELVHSEDRPFKCDVIGCDGSYKSKRNLTAHKRRRHLEVDFEDDFEDEFEDSLDLSATSKRFECLIVGCDERFFTEKDREMHELVHSEDRPFKCDAIGCDSSYKSQRNLTDHKRRRHPEVDEEDDDFEDSLDLLTTSKRLRCRCGCSERFRTENDRQRHEIVHSEDRPFKCHRCDRGFKRRCDLSKHKNNTHSTVPTRVRRVTKPTPRRAAEPTARRVTESTAPRVTEPIVPSVAEPTAPRVADLSDNFASGLKLSQSERKPNSKSRHVWKHCCRWCGCSYRTDNSDDFKEHTNFHINYRPFKCMESGCSHAFMSQLQLECHVRNGHKK